jgi:hypothetical protein
MRTLFVFLVMLACLIVGLFISMHIAFEKDVQESKPYITYSRMIFVASDCDKYKTKYGLWPNTLQQLIAFSPELVDWAKDAFGQGDDKWGRYVVLVPYDSSLGYGKIISYGQDGKPGGIGLDRDLEVRFPTEANADWNKQQVVGLKPPKFRP